MGRSGTLRVFKSETGFFLYNFGHIIGLYVKDKLGKPELINNYLIIN